MFDSTAIQLIILLTLCLCPKTSASDCSSISRFSGDQLENNRQLNVRISISHTPPLSLVYQDNNGTLTIKGIAVDVCDWLSASLHFTYCFVIANKSEEDKYGPVQTSINQLLRGEVDIVSRGLTATPDRLTKMDFSIPVIITEYRLMVPWPKEESRLLATIHPFQSPVWMWIIVSFLSVAPTLNFLSRIYARLTNSDNGEPLIDLSGMGHYVIYTLAILTNQGSHSLMKQMSFVIMTGSWCLVASVLVNAYSCNLISYLTVPKYKPIVQSLEDVAANPDMQFAVDAGTVLADRTLNAKIGAEKILGDKLRANPTGLLTSRGLETLQMLYSDNFAYLGVGKIAAYLVYSTYNKNTLKCNFTVSRNIPNVQFLTFAFPKGGVYNRLFDAKLQLMFEMGLMNYWVEKYSPQIDRCLVRSNNSSPRRLTLVDLSSAFVILKFGISFSLLSFTMEKIVYFTFKCRHQAISARQQQSGEIL